MRVIIVLLILLPFTGTAQEKFHGFYANAKAGVGNWLADDAGVGLSLEGGLVRDKNLFTLSYLRTEEIEERELIHSIDLTLGRYLRKKGLIFHYQAGLGVVWGKNERGEDDPFTTVGVPLKTGVKLVPSNFFSLGLDLQANVNAERSLYQLMFTIGVWPHNPK